MNSDKKNSKYRQGVFVPINKEKFIGSKAFYRSGLELKFMRFCDTNSNVVMWGSENIVVPYISPVDGRAHRYFVDNFVAINEGGVIKKYLVEIKPSKQTNPPTTKYKKKEHLIYEQAMYDVNQAKWNAAREFCKKKGLEFLILTEKEIS
jgi:hypothetical protein